MMTRPELVPPFRLLAYDRIDSTNDEARRLIEAGADHGIVVCAVEQTAGRGRRGRHWHSPRGNLHCSIVLRSARPLMEAAQLGFVAAVALRDALAGLAPAAEFQCKWPNDILCGGSKVAGLLLETAGQGDLIILGVGVNVCSAPDPALYPATSLRAAGSQALADDMMAGFCRGLAEWYDLWSAQGFAPVREAWLRRTRGLGERVEARLAGGETLVGTFAGLDAVGALELDLPAGERRAVLAGDVFFVKSE